MSGTIAIAPVTKSVLVNVPRDRAFEVFTAGIDRWWPKSHSIGATPMLRSVIEPKQNGRWYTVHEDGAQETVGHIVVWEPPARLVFTWEINTTWKADASVASEVEVRFYEDGPTTTRVDLEHRKFEALGEEGGKKMRGDVDGGWVRILDLFRQVAEASASRVVHFEIHASDPEKLAKFYAEVFGWNVNHLPQMDYWLFDTGHGGGINGGMMRRRGPSAPDGAPVNAFVCSIGVASTKDSFSRALAAGATEALPLHAIPGIGWQAYVKDPDGNLVGIHQPDPNAK